MIQIVFLSALCETSNLISWIQYQDAGSVAAACFGPGGIVVAIDQESNSLKLYRDGNWEIHTPPSSLGVMKQPTGVAVTTDGIIYISDTGNDRILQVSNAGKWKLISSGSGTGAGFFNKPRGITLDDTGTLYVADYKNNRIQYYDGKWHTISGSLSGPLDVAIDNNKNLLVADFNNDRIAVINLLSSLWSEYRNINYFSRPTGVACSLNGTVFISSITNSVVVSRSINGSWGILLKEPEITSPCALSVDEYDNIYISDISKKKIIRSKCSNSLLGLIKIDDDNIEPKKQMQYTVDSDVQSVKIGALADSPYSKISGNGNVDLLPGENIITLTIIPETGAPNNYILNITRQVEVDMSLANLTVDGKIIEGFNPARSEYAMLVPFENNNIMINAVPISTLTQVEGNGDIALAEGQNIVKIKVVAQDGTSQDYTLNITRLDETMASPSSTTDNLNINTIKPQETISSDINGDGLPDAISQIIPSEKEKNIGLTIVIIIISIIILAIFGGIIFLLIKRYN